VKVLFVSSEAHPLVKTGGLGDVAGALPRSLQAEGVDVRLLLPAYRHVLQQVESTKPLFSMGDLLGTGEVWLLQGYHPQVTVPIWLVDCPALFDRPGGPYQDEEGSDWADNGIRFSLFARAAALLGISGALTGWRPDVLHLNDRQSGFVPLWLKHWGAERPATLFTVHNLQYQGVFPKTLLSEVGLPEHFYSMHGVEYHQQVSMLKAGLYYADQLSTVSPTYANEIQSTEMGEGLDGLLADRSEQLNGVLNGIDTAVWNPQQDESIAKKYSLETLSSRAINKEQLQTTLGVSVNDEAPLFGLVSRLVPQKGVDLLLTVIPEILQRGAQLVVLGSGDSALEQWLLHLQQQWPQQVGVWIGYNEPLAHAMMAGSDVILVPSRFEPCGLTQMYALRYGALPLVRRTGGLADTVDQQSGFLFDDVSSESLAVVLHEAVDSYSDRKLWKQKQQYAMKQALGWERSAKHYIEIYQSLMQVEE